MTSDILNRGAIRMVEVITENHRKLLPLLEEEDAAALHLVLQQSLLAKEGDEPQMEGDSHGCWSRATNGGWHRLDPIRSDEVAFDVFILIVSNQL